MWSMEAWEKSFVVIICAVIGRRHRKLGRASWLRPITVHSVKMKWGQLRLSQMVLGLTCDKNKAESLSAFHCDTEAEQVKEEGKRFKGREDEEEITTWQAAAAAAGRCGRDGTGMWWLRGHRGNIDNTGANCWDTTATSTSMSRTACCLVTYLL